MLKKIFLIKAITLFLYSCNHVPGEKSLKTDLIEKATDEVKLFINDQYNFFSIGSIDEACGFSTFILTHSHFIFYKIT